MACIRYALLTSGSSDLRAAQAESGLVSRAGLVSATGDLVEPAELTRRFRVDGPAALEEAAGDPVLDYLGYGSLPLAEVMAYRVFEATVHLLDLEEALGTLLPVPVAALSATVLI